MRSIFLRCPRRRPRSAPTLRLRVSLASLVGLSLFSLSCQAEGPWLKDVMGRIPDCEDVIDRRIPREWALRRIQMAQQSNDQLLSGMMIYRSDVEKRFSMKVLTDREYQMTTMELNAAVERVLKRTQDFGERAHCIEGLKFE